MGSYLDVQTKTLPSGRIMFGYNQLNQKIKNEFNSNGEYSNFSQNRSLQLKANTLIKNDPVRAPVLSGLLQSYGIKSNDDIGTYNLFLQGDLKADIFILGYGLTDRVGVFLTLPYLSWKTKMSSNFTKSEKYKNLLGALSDEGQLKATSDFNRGTEDGINYALNQNGLGPHSLESDDSSIGDIQLNLKWISLIDSHWTSSFDPFIVLPTSNEIDESKIVPLSAGDRRWALGFNHMLSYTQGPWETGFSYGLKYPLPATTKSRPVITGNTVSSDDSFKVDHQIKLTGGETWYLHLNQSILLKDTLKFSLGSDFQKKQATFYRGDVFSSDEYRLMTNLSERQLLTGYMGFSYNTIDLFLKNKFMIPMQIALAMQWPLVGENTFSDSTLTSQIYFYF